ncbi:hypothetical protein DH2020_045315 [Rehmannia glutinosa]|uniref:Uncharacterized protein n=1 Tax=Rehmannia glutinosa TaxID=99300 RepID=A0ABR0UF84_REHGL
MYRDLKEVFWWRSMKRDIGTFVEKCLTCQQVKAEHQRPSGLLKPLDIPEWKWEHITMDFMVGLPPSVKIAPIKGVIRFGEKGKLKPRYIGPFEFLARVRDLAYQLVLPLSLSSMHNVFHVSMLRKYVHDLSHIMNYKDLTINNDITYEEAPEAILERKIHHLRNKDIALIRVQWRRRGRNEATWEREEEIRVKNPSFSITGEI